MNVPLSLLHVSILQPTTVLTSDTRRALDLLCIKRRASESINFSGLMAQWTMLLGGQAPFSELT
jgi:hypothetical protein